MVIKIQHLSDAQKLLWKLRDWLPYWPETRCSQLFTKEIR